MPTYEYSCLKCGKEFEAFQPMKDAPLKICTCGKKGKVRRMIGGGAGLIFKGTGFYITDYKKTGASPGKEGGKENVKATSTPPPSKTES
ncbi:MAG: zinc ribbon domain-containing protein [Verrucomicrobia bacterium]|nr:zinc ribbon domain-containing protein [Verrucomicrobiota bacterium]